MTLRHLKIFVTVCKTMNMTVAGEELYLAQPSVSLAVSEMEKFYGIKLFDRIAKKLYLTPSGRVMLDYATHIVASFDEMELTIKNSDTLGEIRIGASITIGNVILPHFLACFNADNPKIETKVIIDNSESIQTKIMDNSIDLGIIEGAHQFDSIVTNKFYHDDLVFLCSNTHKFANHAKIEPTELLTQKFLTREDGSSNQKTLIALSQTLNSALNISWKSTSTQAIVRAVAENLGIALMPRLLVGASIKNNDISTFSVKGIDFKRNYSIIHHKNKYLSAGIKTFIAAIKEF